MARIVLPVRHYVRAKYGRNRNQKMLKVTEGVGFEVPEYSSMDAPVVISLNKSWPVSGLPGQWDPREANEDRFNNGVFDIRYCAGAFYAPMKRFANSSGITPEKLTIDDLRKLDNRSFVFASAFDRALGYDVSPSDCTEGETLCEGDGGITGDWESLNVRSIDPAHDHREKTIKQQAEQLKFAFIDGDLHLRLNDEPRIRYINFPHEVMITVEQDDMLPPRLGGFFPLNRLDDCIEHVEETYPGKPVRLWVKDLIIYDDSIFTIKAEEMALKAAAWELGQSMGRHGNLLNENPAQRRLFFRLNDMRLEHASEEELDLVADILNELSKHDLTMFGINKRELEGAVNRWQVRPVSRGLTR